MNTTEKLIEINFNKKAWQKTKRNIIEWIMLSITLIAVLLIFIMVAGMIEAWNISTTPVVIIIGCLIWILSVFAYLKHIR